MPYLIKRAAKYRLQLFLLGAATLALVVGLPLLNTAHEAEASNPLLNTTFKAKFPGYPDGQEPQGEGDYTYYSDGNGTVEFTLAPNGPVPSGTPTIEINGATNADASISVSGGIITVTVDNAASHLHNNPNNPNDPLNGKLEITVTYPDGSCWHGYITIVTGPGGGPILWDVSQPLEVTLGDGSQGTINANTYKNAEAFPLVRSEGGNYKLKAEFGLDDNGAGGGNNDYQMVLTGLPDQQAISAPAGTTSHTFEFAIPSFALSGYKLNLCLVKVATQEVICRTPVTTGTPGGPITYWGGGYEYDTPFMPPSSMAQCSTCSITQVGETNPNLPAQKGKECIAGYSNFQMTSDNSIEVTTFGGITAGGMGGGAFQTRLDDIGGSAAGGGSLPASLDPAKPESLQIMATEGVGVVMNAGNGHPVKMTTATGELKIENIQTDGYCLNFYKTGVAQPQTCLKIVRPTALESDGSQALRYIEQRFGSDGPGTGSIVETKYTQKKNADGSETWVVYEGAELTSKTASAAPESAFLRKTEIVKSAVADGEHTETVTVSERRADNGSWEVVSVVENTYTHYIWGNPVVKRVLDPNGRNLTSTWSYYKTIQFGLRIGLPQSFRDHAGYWTDYEWDVYGRLTKVKEPFLNASPGAADSASEVLAISYDGNGYKRRETRSVQGSTVAENLVTEFPGYRQFVRLASPGGSASDDGNLVTTIHRATVAPLIGNVHYRFLPNSYQVESITYPNGTRHTCSWDYVGSERERKCKRGNAALTRGSKVVTYTDLRGNAVKIEKSVLDFDNAAGTEQLLYTMDRSNFDGLCRPLLTTTTFEDGSPTQTSSVLYGCCGLKESKDVSGVTTVYHYDHLKRLETSTEVGVTRGVQYNGLSRRTIRMPEADAPAGSHGHKTVRGVSLPASAIVMGGSTTNKAGEHTASLKASPQHGDGISQVTTTYSYSYGAGITITRSNPDGGQEVSVHARDGRRLSISGTAVDNRTYGYGTSLTGVSFAGGSIFGSKTVQANTTQWSATMVDMLGRPVQSVLADADGDSANNPQSTLHYNDLGQLIRGVDPDGVTTLYAYNDEGERTHRARDLNGNGTIDYGVDRITFSETNAATAQDGNTYAWETVSKTFRATDTSASDGLIDNVFQRSIDALKSWGIPYGIAARASSSSTDLKVGGIDGDWTSTFVTPDNLTSVDTHTGGLLRTSVTRGANGTEIVRSTGFFFDGHNRVNRLNDARTGDVTVQYLNNDQRKSVTLQRGSGAADDLTTSFTYDPMGRKLTEDSPDSQDSTGATLSNVVTRTYDKRGNVLSLDGNQAYKRDMAYDALSRLVTMTTHGTQASVTTWNYNPHRGWLDSKQYPDKNNPSQAGQGPSYSFTKAGRVKMRTWARGVTNTYHYDFEGNNTGFGANAKAGDLFGITYSDNTPEIAFSYKRWGALAAISDVAGTRHFAYRESTDLYLSTEDVSSAASAQQQVSIPRRQQHLYDSIGRPTHTMLGTSAQVTALAAEIDGANASGPALGIDHVSEYTYDAQTGRVSGVIHGNAESVVTEAPFTCNYIQDSNLPHETTGPAHKSVNVYEQYRNVLRSKTNNDLAATVAVISAVNYSTLAGGTDGANGIGQREKVTRSSSATYNAVSNTEEWKYNTKGEVVAADHSDVGTASNPDPKDRSYAFDGIGNRTSASQFDPVNSKVENFTYTSNSINQYSSIQKGSNPGVSRVHDADGNLIDDGVKLYSWDAENRLVMVQRKTDNTVIAEYRYDYADRRVYKETTSIAPQGAGANLFVYDGWSLCAEYQATAIASGSNASITSIKRTYTWGMDVSGSENGAGGVGGLLVIEEKSGAHAGKYFPLYDGNGNVTELVKQGGATGTTLVAHYEYDPFGNLSQNDDNDSSGYNMINPFRFSTKYFDQETGFYYYGYRYYDSATGRWLSRDPIEEWGGMNVYGFVGNDGTNWVDAYGLVNWGSADWWDCLCLLGQGAGEGILDTLGGFWDILKDPAGAFKGMIEGLQQLKEAVENGDGFEKLLHDTDWELWVLLYDLHRTSWQTFCKFLGKKIGEHGAGLVLGGSAGAIGKIISKLNKLKASKLAKAAEEAAKKSNKNNSKNGTGETPKPDVACFVAGTLVATEDGKVAIETLKVGDRVLTNDGENQSSSTAVDPATWSKVTLRMANPEFPTDVLHIEVLRSEEWMRIVGCKIGAKIYLILEEMGLEGDAYVTAVEDCPEIKKGKGRVVLSTVTHDNGDVYTVRLKNGEIIEPTGKHLLYSATRGDWTPTERLKKGGVLSTRNGSATIESIVRKPGVHRVFNLEVETEHCYYVSEAEVLNHNTNPCMYQGDPPKKKKTGSYTNTHKSGKKYHGKGDDKRAAKSGKEKAEEYDDPLEDTDWTESDSTRDAFKDEDKRIQEDGGIDNDNNYNKINSPGKKYRQQDGEMTGD